MRMPNVHVNACWSLLCAVLLAAGSGCTTQNVDPDDEGDGNKIGSACTLDEECNGALCVGGVCSATAGGDGGNGSSGSPASSRAMSSGGTASGGLDAGATDLYTPRGIINVTPAMGPIEFGAQRIGQSVEKTITVNNTGDAIFALVQVGIRYQGMNPAQEFTIIPVGPQPNTLGPGEQFTWRINHTPSDGTADHAFFSLVTTAANQAITE